MYNKFELCNVLTWHGISYRFNVCLGHHCFLSAYPLGTTKKVHVLPKIENITIYPGQIVGEGEGILLVIVSTARMISQWDVDELDWLSQSPIQSVFMYPPPLPLVYMNRNLRKNQLLLHQLFVGEKKPLTCIWNMYTEFVGWTKTLTEIAHSNKRWSNFLTHFFWESLMPIKYSQYGRWILKLQSSQNMNKFSWRSWPLPLKSEMSVVLEISLKIQRIKSVLLTYVKCNTTDLSIMPNNVQMTHSVIANIEAVLLTFDP